MSEVEGFKVEIGSGGISEAAAGALVTDMVNRQKSALVMYRVHREAGVLDKYRLLTYRCPRRCLLLDVFRTPAGSAVYFPPVKLSPDHNTETAEAARIERTTDGERRWVERADMLAALGNGPRLPPLHLNCDHTRSSLALDDIHEALRTLPVGTVILSSGNNVR